MSRYVQLSVLLLLVLAHVGNGDRNWHRNFRYSMSSTDISVDDDGNSPLKDKLSLKVHQDRNGIRFFLRWFSRNTDSVETIEAWFRIQQILEYADNAGSSFSRGSSIVLHNYHDWSWKAPVDVSEVGSNLKSFKFRTQDSAFTIIANFNRNMVNGSLLVTPSDIKFDVELNVEVLRNLGWLKSDPVPCTPGDDPHEEYATHHDGGDDNASANCSSGGLAIKGVVQIHGNFAVRARDNSTSGDKEVVINPQGSTTDYAKFSWLSNVDCGNGSFPIVATLPELDDDDVDDERGQDCHAHRMFWYVKADDLEGENLCVWDPTFGAGKAQAAATSLAVSTLFVILALVVSAIL